MQSNLKLTVLSLFMGMSAKVGSCDWKRQWIQASIYCKPVCNGKKRNHLTATKSWTVWTFFFLHWSFISQNRILHTNKTHVSGIYIQICFLIHSVQIQTTRIPFDEMSYHGSTTRSAVKHFSAQHIYKVSSYNQTTTVISLCVILNTC